jgi:DNA-binding protein HU-beta
MACISNNDKIHLNKNTVKKERTKIMANTIRKNDIVTSIVETTSMTKTEANRAFDIIFETISNALAKGDSVQISGFGTFEVRERAARTGRNPKTGETIQIAASKAVGFKAGKTIKEKVNG